MEGGALKGAVSLTNDHDIDAAWQRRLIYALVQFFDSHQDLTRQLSHVVHGVCLQAQKKGDESNVEEKQIQIRPE